MKSICTERVWKFPWEQAYEEYLESQEDDEYSEDSQDDEDDDETRVELIEEAILNSSKYNDIVFRGIKCEK